MPLWGYQRYVRRVLKESEGEEPLSLRYVLHFFWPLALIMSIRGFSRPLINLFISWGPNGAEALAVLTVVYSLAYVFYGWLNEMRSLAPAFKAHDPDLSHTFGFALSCGTFSFGMMVLVFWTPVRDYILQTLLGLKEQLATLSRMP